MSGSSVVSSFSYAATNDRPFIQDFSEPKNNYKPLEQVTFNVADARPLRDQLSLDDQGFILDETTDVETIRRQSGDNVEGKR